jgi:hypothetical protein
MLVIRPEDCPEQITVADAIDIAYGEVLAEAVRRLRLGVSVLIECEKELGIPVLLSMRARLKTLQPPIATQVIAGRPTGGDTAGPPVSLTTAMYRELLAYLQNPGDKVPVIQHLDLLTAGVGGGVTLAGMW